MICENCGKEHNGNYGTGRFCSQECARSYATNHEENKHELKKAKCINCGKIIYIDKRASNKKCLCNDCKTLKKCKICGKLFNGTKSQIICSNECNHIQKILPTLIKYLNFNKETIGTENIFDEVQNIKNYLNKLYWEDNKSFSDICKIIGYKSNPGNLTKFFRNLGLYSRTFKEATINSYLTGKLGFSNHNCVWHTTWNNKEVYLRSSYELDYAKQLDEQHINYEVEFTHIKYWDSQKQEYRCAIPDFYIPNTNTIIEIKSNWTLDKQNMIDKFKAYKELGYNCKLICDHKEIIL